MVKRLREIAPSCAAVSASVEDIGESTSPAALSCAESTALAARPFPPSLPIGPQPRDHPSHKRDTHVDRVRRTKRIREDVVVPAPVPKMQFFQPPFPPGDRHEVELLGMNGNVIQTFTFKQLHMLTVGTLVWYMEFGSVPGVAGVREDNRGRLMESFNLVHGVQPMEGNHKVLDYFDPYWTEEKGKPDGEFRMTLVRVPVDEARRVHASCRTMA